MNRVYDVITKTSLDKRLWYLVTTKTWRGTHYVSHHRTLREANAAIERYRITPPQIGYVIA